MYRLNKTKAPNVLEIEFDYFEPLHGFDPFHDIIEEYAAESEIHPETVDFLYNYKFIEDSYKIQFYWNACFRIYIFYIAPDQFDLVYQRLSGICAKLNRQLNEKHRKYGYPPRYGYYD